MSYRLIYTKHAAKDIRGLSPELKQRLKSTLEKYSHDPPKLRTQIDSS